MGASLSDKLSSKAISKQPQVWDKAHGFNHQSVAISIASPLEVESSHAFLQFFDSSFVRFGLMGSKEITDVRTSQGLGSQHSQRC